jgi:hypothetical protein
MAARLLRAAQTHLAAPRSRLARNSVSEAASYVERERLLASDGSRK